jgi:hypothetical protein
MNDYPPGDPENFRPQPFQASTASIHVYPFVTVIEKPNSPIQVLVSERHGTQWLC